MNQIIYMENFQKMPAWAQKLTEEGTCPIFSNAIQHYLRGSYSFESCLGQATKNLILALNKSLAKNVEREEMKPPNTITERIEKLEDLAGLNKYKGDHKALLAFVMQAKQEAIQAKQEAIQAKKLRN